MLQTKERKPMVLTPCNNISSNGSTKSYHPLESRVEHKLIVGYFQKGNEEISYQYGNTIEQISKDGRFECDSLAVCSWVSILKKENGYESKKFL